MHAVIQHPHEHNDDMQAFRPKTIFVVRTLKCKFTRVCSVRYVSRHTAGISGTGQLGKFGTTSIPVPHNSVSSVRHQYRCRTLR